METNKLSFDGSTELIIEFLEYSISSILVQRSVYPPSNFERIKWSSFTVMKPRNPRIKEYLTRILDRLGIWIKKGSVSHVGLIIADRETDAAVEKWVFKIENLQASNLVTVENFITEEIAHCQANCEAQLQNVLINITNSVSFLPLLCGVYTFHIAVIENSQEDIPEHWGAALNHEIENPKVVSMDGFQTQDRSVGTCVIYKA